MSEKIHVVATVVAKPGSEAELREAFRAFLPFAATEPGFIQYDLHESREVPGRFVFYEIWRDQAALDLHANTPEMRAQNARIGEWVESVHVETFRKID